MSEVGETTVTSESEELGKLLLLQIWHRERREAPDSESCCWPKKLGISEKLLLELKLQETAVEVEAAGCRCFKLKLLTGAAESSICYLDLLVAQHIRIRTADLKKKLLIWRLLIRKRSCWFQETLGRLPEQIHSLLKCKLVRCALTERLLGSCK